MKIVDLQSLEGGRAEGGVFKNLCTQCCTCKLLIGGFSRGPVLASNDHTVSL
jgi:hypothetical protein